MPSNDELYKASPAAKNYFINKELFTMNGEGMLIKKGEVESDNRMVVPKELRDNINEMCHDIPSSAHQGVERTTARVKQRYYWYSYQRDVRNYVATCKECNRSKKTMPALQ